MSVKRLRIPRLPNLKTGNSPYTKHNYFDFFFMLTSSKMLNAESYTSDILRVY